MTSAPPVGGSHPTRGDDRRAVLGAAIALAAMVALVLVALAVGRFPISPAELARLLWSGITGAPAELPDAMTTVLFRVRGPRILAAVVTGAALSAAGAAYQG